MTTALLILAALVIVVLLVAVLCQMCGSFTMWVFHLCCGTVNGLLQVLAWVFGALGEALTGSN